MSTRPTRFLPILLCILPYGCTLGRTESTAPEKPLHFTVGQGRRLREGRQGGGRVRRRRQRTVLRHAYAVLDKAWNEDVADVETGASPTSPCRPRCPPPGGHGRKGKVRYLEARLDDKGGLASVHVCNRDVAEICIKTVEFGDRKTKLELDQRDGHQLEGTALRVRPEAVHEGALQLHRRVHGHAVGDPSDHLATKPDGSFGVAPG